MKTISVGVENLCVPCGCKCRYCLLSYDGKPVGVDYGRGKRFAENFFDGLAQVKPDLRRFFYIGYCMDAPMLTDYIKFCQSIGSPSGEFLQLNGLSVRSAEKTERFIDGIARAGIKTVDLTFYGSEEYHDKFCARSGDFAFLLQLASSAGRAGIEVRASIPIVRENMSHTENLLDILEDIGVGQYFAFLPHGKGRGRKLNNLRLTYDEFHSLPERVLSRFSTRVEYKSEGEWLRAGNWINPETRTLTLSLTSENIERLEGMSAEETVAMLENADDEYYSVMPSPKELAKRYGRIGGTLMYRRRDLLLEWRQRYFNEFCSGIHDMDDETGHFSVRN